MDTTYMSRAALGSDAFPSWPAGTVVGRRGGRQARRPANAARAARAAPPAPGFSGRCFHFCLQFFSNFVSYILLRLTPRLHLTPELFLST